MMTALLLIDIQEGFKMQDHWGGQRNNLDAELNCRLLLDFFRVRQLPLFHVQHCSSQPDSPLHPTHIGNQFQKIVEPLKDEPVIKKNVNSAFVGTNLQQLLDSQHIDSVIICGLTTDHCISTSVRMSANLGFNTIVVADATATFDKTGNDGVKYGAELIHKTALASLNDEFAQVINTRELLKQLKTT